MEKGPGGPPKIFSGDRQTVKGLCCALWLPLDGRRGALSGVRVWAALGALVLSVDGKLCFWLLLSLCSLGPAPGQLRPWEGF